MELTRRDAVLALAAVGAGGIAIGAIGWTPSDDPTDDTDERIRETLVAAAEVVYPSEVNGIEEFVETFLAGRLAGGSHADGLREAVETLDDRARTWYGDDFVALSADDRDSLLREIGAETAEERRDGSAAERVRYYVVNELLLALYSSPTGGELVGIENPQGHAGGIDTYERGPQL